MSVRQSLKTRTDIVELIDFAQDRLKRHGHTAFSLKQPKVEELQMDDIRRSHQENGSRRVAMSAST